MTKKKILVFTGSGVSAESGIETFRTGNGLWCQYKIEDVATPSGWRKDKNRVLEFYNDRRRQMRDANPNLAHMIISNLEKDFDVTIVTQNIDDLHERAGSTDIIHLHGELNKVRSTLDTSLVYDCDGDCNVGDKCEKGSQLRPHIIWFNENLDQRILTRAEKSAIDCDICIVVGTSMQVSPANTIPFLTKDGTPIYYIDPADINFDIPIRRVSDFNHIKEIASVGMTFLKNKINL